MIACGECDARSVVTGATACAVAASALMVVAAAVVAATGSGGFFRDQLQFGFAGVPRTIGEAAGIALHNAKFAAGALIGAAITPHTTQRMRHVVDAVLGMVLVVNAVAIGLVLGAYGSRAMAALALHAPLEIAAMSLAGGAYLRSRTVRLGTSGVAVVGAGSIVLLALAAALETYASAGGPR